MTIDTPWLDDVLALTLGRRPDAALVEELAGVLATPEEVLPWLILRQGAFADDPQICAQLQHLAAQPAGPSSHRPAGPPLCPQTIERDRQADHVLRELVAQSIDSTALADTLGAILHRQNQILSGRADYDFRRRIAEPAPSTAANPANDPPEADASDV